jgi:hypothetical protein
MYMRIDLISDRHPQALALRNLWETLIAAQGLYPQPLSGECSAIGAWSWSQCMMGIESSRSEERSTVLH